MLEESKKDKERAEKVEEGKEDQETNTNKNETKTECKKVTHLLEDYIHIEYL